MASQLIPFQFQFDVVGGAVVAKQFVSYMLSVCNEDDIQPMALEPLERFGGLLMADGSRIQQGADALKHRHEIRWKSPLKVVTPRLAALVADNSRLTSVFLFAAACSIYTPVSSTSKIVYEMMRLHGLIDKYPISSEVVLRFVETLNGCRDQFNAPQAADASSPTQILSKLSRKVTTASNLRPDDPNLGLWRTSGVNLLADLLFRTFEAVADTNNKCIELQGHHCGIFVAFVLVWMRPSEVAVFLQDEQLYPWEGLLLSERIEPRILVRFGHLHEDDDEAWAFKTWQNASQASEPIVLNDEPRRKLNVDSAVPWGMAKTCLESTNFVGRKETISAIGYLAAALVQACTEWGVLKSSAACWSARLKDIYPEWYLNAYSDIIERFGWMDL